MHPGDGSGGTWLNMESCPQWSYARGLRVKIEGYQGKYRDDSGLNSIELICRNMSGIDTA